MQIDLETVEVLPLQPGDILLVHVNGRISQAAESAIREQVQRLAPGHDVAILTEGMRISVIREEKPSQSWRDKEPLL